MSRNRFSNANLSIPEIIGFGLGIIIITSLIVAFQAWLLALVLSWFGITLSFWKSVVVVVLIGMLFGSTRASSN
jgi:hypothetical protein